MTPVRLPATLRSRAGEAATATGSEMEQSSVYVWNRGSPNDERGACPIAGQRASCSPAPMVAEWVSCQLSHSLKPDR